MDNVISIEKIKFYKSDILNLKEYPDVNNEYKTRRTDVIIDLSSFSSNLFKDCIKSYIEEYLFNKKYAYINRLKSYYIPLNYFLQFLSQENSTFEKINDLNFEILENSYKTFLIKNNITYKTSSKRDGIISTKNFNIISKIFQYEKEYFDRNKNIWDKDTWYLDILPITVNRINETDSMKSINFNIIKNLNNKNLAKMYIKHLIITTNKKMTTIKGILKNIKIFVLFLCNKKIQELNSQIILEFYNFLETKKLGNMTYNRIINQNSDFLEYLVSKNIIDINFIKANKEIKKAPRNYKLSSVDDFIIKQIFNNLDKIDEKLRDMFLICYCTGMRASDVSCLTLDCLYSNELKSQDGTIKTRYFIRYYCTKLSKYNETPIPKILFDIIKDRIEYVKSFKYSEQFLFNSCKSENKPYIASTYNEQMKNALRNANIKNVDGSDYIFHSHDFRHTLATDMVNMDIPFDVIRRILHHVSPEMTLYYAEIRSRKEIDMQKEFINNMGEKIVFQNDIELGDIAEINWLRKNINAQILPNGFCGLPVKMGKCDSGNYCLECSKFRTDETFLEVHKQQLEVSKRLLENAKENGWEIQIETNKKVINTLEKIISSIEKENKYGNESD